MLQAMDYSASVIMTTQSIKNSTTSSINKNPAISNNNNNSLQPTSSSTTRFSDALARKRALMHRDYQWTTTVEGLESMAINNVNTNSHNQYTNSTKPVIPSESTNNSEMHTDRTRTSSIKGKINPKNDSSNSNSSVNFRRRRSSRRLPEIPSNRKTSSNNKQVNIVDEIKHQLPFYTSDEYSSKSMYDNPLYNRVLSSKSIDSGSSLIPRVAYSKLFNTYQSPNAKSVDLSNLTRRKSFLIVNNALLPQRSIDYPCIVRKKPDLSDIVRQRMLYSKISKQQQGDNFSLSLEREHVPRVPRKIIIRQDNSIEIALR